MSLYDVAVIGGGIVGLSTAFNISKLNPKFRIVVIEKENSVAKHQTGHNSGVVHSGIYYKPNSLKAALCLEGRRLMNEFCSSEGIAVERCGKVIVATEQNEMPRLMGIYERGQKNGVACELIGTQRLLELEPSVRGVGALHVPETAIVEYGRVCAALARKLQSFGHEIRTDTALSHMRERSDGVQMDTSRGGLCAKVVIACAGLHADRVLNMVLPDKASQIKIVPFRGEYYELSAQHKSLCRNLIYPVPDPAFPFLGVHLTRRIDSSVECGPNAVLALAREGYSWGHIQLRDLAEIVGFPGALRLFKKHLKYGLGETWRSINKKAFVAALQKLIPDIQAGFLSPGSAGVRAQAVDRQGNLIDDFLIHRTDRTIHVVNAPSPAATASFAIGAYIARMAI